MKQLNCPNCRNVIEYEDQSTEIVCLKCNKRFRLQGNSNAQGGGTSGKGISTEKSDSESSSLEQSPPKKKVSFLNSKLGERKSNPRENQEQSRSDRDQNNRNREDDFNEDSSPGNLSSRKTSRREENEPIDEEDDRPRRSQSPKSSFSFSNRREREERKEEDEEDRDRDRDRQRYREDEDYDKRDRGRRRSSRWDQEEDDYEENDDPDYSDRISQRKIRANRSSSLPLFKLGLTVHMVSAWTITASFGLLASFLVVTALLVTMRATTLSFLSLFLNLAFIANFGFYIIRLVACGMHLIDKPQDEKSKIQLLLASGLFLLNFILVLAIVPTTSGFGSNGFISTDGFLPRFVPLEAISCLIITILFSGHLLEIVLLYLVEMAGMFFYFQYIVSVNETRIRARTDDRFQQLPWYWLYTISGAVALGIIISIFGNMDSDPKFISILLFIFILATLVLCGLETLLLAMSLAEMVKRCGKNGPKIQKKSKGAKRKSENNPNNDRNENRNNDRNNDRDSEDDNRENRKRIGKNRSRANEDSPEDEFDDREESRDRDRDQNKNRGRDRDDSKRRDSSRNRRPRDDD